MNKVAVQGPEDSCMIGLICRLWRDRGHHCSSTPSTKTTPLPCLWPFLLHFAFTQKLFQTTFPTWYNASLASYGLHLPRTLAHTMLDTRQTASQAPCQLREAYSSLSSQPQTGRWTSLRLLGTKTVRKWRPEGWQDVTRGRRRGTSIMTCKRGCIVAFPGEF